MYLHSNITFPTRTKRDTSRDTAVSRAKYIAICAARDAQCLYYATTRYQKPCDYRISITANPIRF